MLQEGDGVVPEESTAKNPNAMKFTGGAAEVCHFSEHSLQGRCDSDSFRLYTQLQVLVPTSVCCSFFWQCQKHPTRHLLHATLMQLLSVQRDVALNFTNLVYSVHTV